MEHLSNLLDQQLLACLESESFAWFHTLGQLHRLGTILEEEWSIRPEFDQDDNLFSTLGSECLDRARADCLSVVGKIGRSFISSIEPWLRSRVRANFFVSLFSLTNSHHRDRTGSM